MTFLPKADKGYLEVEIKTWSELQQYTNYFSDYQKFIFRGQGDSEWPLETTFDRYLRKFKQEQAEIFKVGSLYTVHLKNFKDSLRGRGLKLDGMSDNELWALGQHYGLYTPLLDWTYSFYIALFFAFYADNHEPKKGYRSVYALSALTAAFKYSIELYNKDKEDFQKFELIVSTSEDNPRVINQAGLFTKFPFDFDLQEWVQEHQDTYIDIDVLIKINIPETERRRVLKELSLMNINPKTMFPDLQGSALNCNFKFFLFADKVRFI